LNYERHLRLQRIVDAVEERHDEKPCDVTLTWGELREFLSAYDTLLKGTAAGMTLAERVRRLLALEKNSGGFDHDTR
jgi:hypothetical protein